MAKTPRERYQTALQKLREATEAGDVEVQDQEAITEMCQGYDKQNLLSQPPDDDSTKAPETLKTYAQRLLTITKRLDSSLIEADADSINHLMQSMFDGSHAEVTDDGLSQNTISSYQATTRKFFEFHGLDVDPNDVTLLAPQKTSIDPDDMLTREEITELRGAFKRSRNRALFEMLLYTGQRQTALRTLRIQDINLDDATYRYNEDADGLKGAERNGKKRPLLASVGAIRDWLQYHPASDDPDAILLCALNGHGDPADGYEAIGHDAVNNVLKRAKARTTVDKPLTSKALRHNFATTAKREYGLDDSTIKYLLGHSPDSQVMETTYAHLSDEDHIKAAEIGAGLRDPEPEDSVFTPSICPVCKEPLDGYERACPRCGTAITPDAQQTKNEVEKALWEGKSEAQDEKVSEAIDALRDAIETNPDAVIRLLNQSQSQDTQ
jgi:integrase